MRTRALCLVVLAACSYKNRVKDMHATARAENNWKEAVSYSDAMAKNYDPELNNKPISPTKLDEISAQRVQDMSALIVQTRTRGTLTKDTAADWFGTFLGLRNEVRRGTKLRVATYKGLDDEPIQRELDRAADELWPDVLALIEAGQLSKAILAGAQLAEHAPTTSGAQKYAEAVAKAAALHLELATQAGTAQPAARLMHARIAKLYGGTVPPELLDATPLIAATKFEFQVQTAPSSKAGCAESADTVKSLFEGKSTQGGEPVVAVVSLSECEHSETQLPPVEKYIPYKEERQKQVPVESWGSSYHTELGPLEQHIDNSGASPKVVTTRSPIQVYNTPTKGYNGETETVTYYEDQVETVMAQRMQTTASVAGTVQLIIGDDVFQVAFRVRGTSDIEERYKGAHTPPRAYDREGSKLQAEFRMNNELLDKATALLEPVRADRAKKFFASGMAATEPLKADNDQFIAALIRPYAAEPYAKPIQDRHKLEYSVINAALVEDQKLAVNDYAEKHKVEIREVGQWEIDGELANSFERQAVDESLTLAFVVGGSSTTGMEETDYGVVGAFRVFIQGHGHPLFAAGGGFRMGGGYGGAGGYFDADFIASGGLRLGPLFIGPLVGLGGDFTPTYELAGATKFGVTPGVYAELGIRTRVMINPLHSQLEGIYAKVARTGDISAERRLDGRLSFGTKSVLVRYAEYAVDHNAFLSPFTTDGRFGKSLWLMAGVGF